MCGTYPTEAPTGPPPTCINCIVGHRACANAVLCCAVQAPAAKGRKTTMCTDCCFAYRHVPASLAPALDLIPVRSLPALDRLPRRRSSFGQGCYQTMFRASSRLSTSSRCKHRRVDGTSDSSRSRHTHRSTWRASCCPRRPHPQPEADRSCWQCCCRLQRSPQCNVRDLRPFWEA